MKKKIRKKQTSQFFLSVKEDILFLLLKAGILAGLLLATFVFVFGVLRCGDDSMKPSVKNGDLVLFYRLQNDYHVSDAVVIEKNGVTEVRRIAAKAGDVVDITADGLKINGYLQQEAEIYVETLPYQEGISYPLTLGTDEYFVLGDARRNARDSRIYGAVKKSEIKGIVMTLLRRRGI